MNFSFYEQDQEFITNRLFEGEFDYVDSVDEVLETDFFRSIGSHSILRKLGESYPSPRKKEEVPTWIYIASNLAMRLRGVQAFSAFPHVIKTSGLLTALGNQLGKRIKGPENGTLSLQCDGFNNKNDYDRETPCDQDFLRKLARDTQANKLQEWYNQDVVKILKQQKAFDPEGIFIGDGSYLFVPDNEHYENSAKMLFDENDHPVKDEDITAKQREKCRWRRCYKMISLLHVRRNQDAFVFAAIAVVPGNKHECPILFKLVDGFVKAAGKGVMKRLILDRGFLDGANIARIKQDYGIDTLIPVKSNLILYKDILARAETPDIPYREYVKSTPEPVSPPPQRPRKLRPRKLRKREAARIKTLKQKRRETPPPPPENTLTKTEVGAVTNLTSLKTCAVPLHAVINLETYGDGHQKAWILLDTRVIHDPAESRREYALRTDIEERHRQLKCFANLTNFTSQAFTLVVNQVIFTLLAYSLLQLFLLKKKRQDLNSKTPPGIRRALLPSASHVIVYCENYFAFFSLATFLDTVLSLTGEARRKASARARNLRYAEENTQHHPRSP